MTGVPHDVFALARSARTVTVLTGAGMSAESGVPTFRDAQTGLWTQVAPEDLATPEGWERDKAYVNAWFLWRVHLVRSVEPNAGHYAIARWAAFPDREIRIVTQNIDDLHERAGSPVLAHVHGSLFEWRCDRCERPAPTPEPPFATTGPIDHIAPDQCIHCASGEIRPGVVWFNEPLPQDSFFKAALVCRDADLVLVVGTSGIVQPAATLPHLAMAAGVPVIELDPRPTEFSPYATHVWRTTAALGLPALVDALADQARGGIE
ncbi:MAG: NAD-dependent deacylase [Candidatus Phosphoribacter sp.]|nr:NAD-dependent deacylase [Actinomycetales bacterium]